MRKESVNKQWHTIINKAYLACTTWLNEVNSIIQQDLDFYNVYITIPLLMAKHNTKTEPAHNVNRLA